MATGGGDCVVMKDGTKAHPCLERSSSQSAPVCFTLFPLAERCCIYDIALLLLLPTMTELEIHTHKTVIKPGSNQNP